MGLASNRKIKTNTKNNNISLLFLYYSTLAYLDYCYLMPILEPTSKDQPLKRLLHGVYCGDCRRCLANRCLGCTARRFHRKTLDVLYSNFNLS